MMTSPSPTPTFSADSWASSQPQGGRTAPSTARVKVRHLEKGAGPHLERVAGSNQEGIAGPDQERIAGPDQ